MLHLGLHHTHLQEQGHQARVPVVGHKHAVLSRAKGQHLDRLNGSLAEQGEALVVVHIVCTRASAIQLAAGLTPHTSQEPVLQTTQLVGQQLLLVCCYSQDLLLGGMPGGMPGKRGCIAD